MCACSRAHLVHACSSRFLPRNLAPETGPAHRLSCQQPSQRRGGCDWRQVDTDQRTVRAVHAKARWHGTWNDAQDGSDASTPFCASAISRIARKNSSWSMDPAAERSHRSQIARSSCWGRPDLLRNAAAAFPAVPAAANDKQEINRPQKRLTGEGSGGGGRGEVPS